jgi:hypothetical protein
MERGDKRVIDLKQGLAAGQDDIASVRRSRPFCLDRISQRIGIRKSAAAGPVDTDKIGITKSAD